MTKITIYSILLFFFVWGCVSQNPGRNGNHYYINSQTGSDDNDGLSVDAAWKSLRNLENTTFQPGDSILFAKNSIYVGGVNINFSGNTGNQIVLSSYGKGTLPQFSNPDSSVLNGNVFQIKGSQIVIDGLSFNNCADAYNKRGKAVLEVGAIFSHPGADYITIKNCTFTDCPIAVNITGQHSLITKNILKDCNRFLAAPDWGPIGIVIANAYNEVSYNTCSNYVNIGGNYGADGGFIELDDRYFGTKVHDIKIHHNKSFDNMGFLEIETKIVGNNIDVYYNLSDDYQQFIFYWGGDNSRIENNTVIRTKPSLNGAVNTVFTMRKGNFTVRNNIFIVANGLQVFVTAPYDVGNYDQVVHDHNLYYCIDGSTDDPCGKPLGADEIIANPLFKDLKGGDFHLRSGSPAIDKGMALGYGSDLDHSAIAENQKPDLGAYEWK